MQKIISSLIGLGLLTGCAIGPNYVAVNPVPTETFAHASASDMSAWQPVVPVDASGASQWWLLFNDPQLDQWLTQLTTANADIAQAEARYRQASASLQQARSELLPIVSSQASAQRSGAGQMSPSNQYNLNASISWELDLWGRVRRAIESSDANVAASAADLLALRLSLESTFAQSYFQAKNVRAAQQLYDQTITAYERSLQITQQRLAVGMVSPADVASAEAQLENARLQRLALDRQWGQLTNAMAVLLGQAPSAFAFTVDGVFSALPTVPVALPAQVLLQRPDVAAAERRVAAANAQIGVAQSAWLPALGLSAQGGYRSGSWADWISAPARFWSLGPALALTLFDGGARTARINETIAAYDAQAAAYKKTVLEALREVEDSLVQWHGLHKELTNQQRALDAARRSLQLTRNQYEAGLIDYLSVVQVEANALSAERAMLSLQSNLFMAATQLITSLGGRW